MNDIRKLMEAIEEINEVSDFDGDALDTLIAQFEETANALGLVGNPVKERELMQVVLARAFKGLREDYSESSEEMYADTLDDLIKDIQQLEEDTLRVYQEAASEESKARPDYTQMLLNELRETVKQITEIARKYDY